MVLKKIIGIISLAVFLIFIFLVVFKLRGKIDTSRVVEEVISGKEMTFKAYNSDHNLVFEIKSSDSEKDFDMSRKPAQRERTLLKNIKGTIYKKGRFKSDTHFSSEKGYVENNNQNLLLKKNALIESEEMRFASDKFFMEGNSLVSNDTSTDFIIKDLQGTASRGLEFHVRINVINMFGTSGSFVKEGKTYDFKCKKLVILDNRNLVVFKGNAIIEGDDSTMKGNEISMFFTDDFKKIKRSVLKGNSYFYLKGKKSGEYREAMGFRIGAAFNDNGKVNRIEVKKNGIINLRRTNEKIKVESDFISIKFNEISEKTEQIRTLRGSRIISKGKRKFDISSKRMRVHYGKNGDPEYCYAKQDCLFKMDGYSGSSDKLDYEVKKNFVKISGRRSILEKKGNRFVSTEFNLNTKEEKFYSESKITSSIILDSGNALFSKSQIFISSKKVEILEKAGSIKYSGDVNLFQGDTKLYSDILEIIGEKEIKASGKTSILFKEKNNDIFISGGELGFLQEENSIQIGKGGSLKEGNNSLNAQTLKIEFNKENNINRITGIDKVKFMREKISGISDSVVWEFDKKFLVFNGNASVAKEKSGLTSGNIIKFYLEGEKVVITSPDGSRSKTTIE
ncbi:MAG: LptA/OstA family protein [Acidobacteriota bacterium]